jgi:hypothetical protein
MLQTNRRSKPIFDWDGLAEYLAMYYGWKTRTFFDLPANHLAKKRALSREKNQKELKQKVKVIIIVVIHLNLFY